MSMFYVFQTESNHIMIFQFSYYNIEYLPQRLTFRLEQFLLGVPINLSCGLIRSELQIKLLVGNPSS